MKDNVCACQCICICIPKDINGLTHLPHYPGYMQVEACLLTTHTHDSHTSKLSIAKLCRAS